AAESSALQFAGPEAQEIPELQAPRDDRQRLAIYQRGTQTAHRALVRLRELEKQGLGNHHAQHRVAEEFETLVVRGTEAAMRERGLQQFRLLERVADALANLAGKIFQRSASTTLSSKFTSRWRLP